MLITFWWPSDGTATQHHSHIFEARIVKLCMDSQLYICWLVSEKYNKNAKKNMTFNDNVNSQYSPFFFNYVFDLMQNILRILNDKI